MVAKRSTTIGGNTWTTSYEHTDALHSPITETNSSANASRIERYTPWGEPGDNIYAQGPGFTGHVTDAATGLTYAQQRYYDPVIGRFLSVDPVAASDNGANFNRYWYANNNPYRFTDRDGRAAEPAEEEERDEEAFEELLNPKLNEESSRSESDAQYRAFYGKPSISDEMRGHTDDLIRGDSGGPSFFEELKEAENKPERGAANGPRAYKPFTRAGKVEVKASNAKANGGQTTCVNCRQPTVPAKQSSRGVTPPKNETHVDHYIPRSQGGNGSPDNGQVLCGGCNLGFGANRKVDEPSAGPGGSSGAIIIWQ